MAQYSTMQQYQPFRVPQGWNTQERKFVMQLEETLDDIYRRFGRLKLSDMGEEFRVSYSVLDETAHGAVEGLNTLTSRVDDVEESVEAVEGRVGTAETNIGGLSLRLTNAEGDITDIEVAAGQLTTRISDIEGNTYTKSETSTLIETKMTNALGDYYTKSETATKITTELGNALGDYSTTSQTAAEINTRIQNALGDYSTTSQTAAEINTRIQNALGDYSTTQQTANAIATAVSDRVTTSTFTQRAEAIELAVQDKYGKVSGINIDTNGVAITGSKSVTISGGSSFSASGGSGSMTIDSNGATFTGKVQAKDGYIGAWSIKPSWIYSGTGGNAFVLVGAAKDTDTPQADWDKVKDYAFYVGADWPANSNASLLKNGDFYATRIFKWNGTSWQQL